MKTYLKNIVTHPSFVFFAIAAILFLTGACSPQRDYKTEAALMGGDGGGDDPPEDK